MASSPPAAAPHSSDSPAEWRRLHPMSPVVRFGRLLVGALVVIIPLLESRPPTRHGGGAVLPLPSLIVWLILVGISTVAGVITWLVTRWRVSGTDLQIETGLIRRQSFRIPLARIQAVDIVAPLTARIFGLAEVRVVSAGRGGERGRLAYLTAEQATAVRARLLALAHGLQAETPEPPAQALLRVDNARLIVALSLRAGVLVHVALIAMGIALLAIVPRLGAALAGTTITTIFTAVYLLARTFNEDFDFSVSEAGDGLRLDRGLLQKRHETIPFGRIQAVRVVQPLLWRPAGWLRLEVDVARQHESGQGRETQRVARTLLPVGSHHEVAALLGRVFPESGMAPPPSAHPPRRAVLKAPLSYHFLAAWYGERYVYARTGRLQAATVVAPLHKIQSVRFSSGPVQRRLRLATLHVDTAGQRWAAAARCRDEREAERMLWDITTRARVARRQTAVRPAVALSGIA